MSLYLSNEMKCCVKFQTAINSSRKMKHGNFRASKATDIELSDSRFHSREEADIKTETF